MKREILFKELKFKAVRSSGPGGQHVNKTASKVELSLNIVQSGAFSDSEKSRLLDKLKTRLSKEGILILQSAETRSQHRNKAIAIERLLDLVTENLKVVKKRKKTKPSKGAIERRLKSKKNQALKKVNRKRPKID